MASHRPLRRTGQVWSIVLAAGNGTRLRGMVSQGLGVDCPKQFCAFNGSGTLLRQAIERARVLSSIKRVVPVVAADHRRWWEPELVRLPRENVIIQPCNRGTACGLLLPLVHILLRDPQAVIVALPSDHLVGDEQTLAAAARKGITAARSDNESIVLLGIEPDSADSDLGWITPSQGATDGPQTVLRFVEKPTPEVARQLMDGGGLLNSFVFVARGLTLLSMCEKASPGIVQRFGAAVVNTDSTGRAQRIVELYDQLPMLDLSQDVLSRMPSDLRVIPVPPCGWTDLGTPERVLRRARDQTLLPRDRSRSRGASPADPPDLALAAQSYLAHQTAGPAVTT